MQSEFPRRQALLGRLRRDYPSLERYTLAEETWLDLRPDGSVAVTLFVRSDEWPESALRDLLDRLRAPLGPELHASAHRLESSLWRLE